MCLFRAPYITEINSLNYDQCGELSEAKSVFWCICVIRDRQTSLQNKGTVRPRLLELARLCFTFKTLFEPKYVPMDQPSSHKLPTFTCIHNIQHFKNISTL